MSGGIGDEVSVEGTPRGEEGRPNPKPGQGPGWLLGEAATFGLKV